MTKKGRTRATRRDPRRRFETTLAEDLPATTGGAPAHKAGAAVIVNIRAAVPGLGLVTFTAPRPSHLLLTAARERAKEATSLRTSLIRKIHLSPGPAGLVRVIPESLLFRFLQAAIAAIVLAHTALDNFTVQSLQDDIVISHPKDGRTMGRSDIEGSGLELRMTKAMSTATGRENIATADPELFAQAMALKDLRDRVAHLKPGTVFSTTEPNKTLWIDLLGIQQFERATVDIVDAVVMHYGLDAPAATPGV